MSNVAHLLELQLSPAQLGLLRRASKVSDECQADLYLVGGTVRDILTGSRPIDLDLMFAGVDPLFPSALAEGLGGDVVARTRFGTAKLRIGGIDMDLAAARKESYAHPGALPTVFPGAVEEDLGRRDFSVNAMAVALGEHTFGELVDPLGAQSDLEHGLVRVLHANSFVDDATRILRAVRYSQRDGFRLEAHTERMLRRDLSYLSGISGDRIRHELERIFREPRAVDMLWAAQQLGVLSAIHPALGVEPAVLARFRAVSVGPTPDNDMRLLTLLVYSAPAEALLSIIGRLQLVGRSAQVVRDVGAVRDSFRSLKGERIRPSRVVELLCALDASSIEGCAIAVDEPLVKQRLELYLTKLHHVKPLLNGRDLIALGVPEGPMVGKLLRRLLMSRLDGLLSTREDEEALVLRSVGGGGH